MSSIPLSAMDTFVARLEDMWKGQAKLRDQIPSHAGDSDIPRHSHGPYSVSHSHRWCHLPGREGIHQAT
eukprot:3218990-Amphidinium_carterae.1